MAEVSAAAMVPEVEVAEKVARERTQLAPFFTRDLVVSKPPVTGLWTHQGNVYEFGSRISRRAGSGISGPIESTFFLIDGQLFLDTTAGKIKKEELERTITVRDGLAYLSDAKEPFSGQAGAIDGSRVSKWSRFSRGFLKRAAFPDADGGRGKEEIYAGGRLVAVDRWVNGKLEAEFLGPQPVDIPLPEIAQPQIPPELASGGASVERGDDGIFRLAGIVSAAILTLPLALLVGPLG